MATIETPPKADRELPASRRGRPALRVTSSEVEEFHLLISELRDDNSRSRLREAAWISIIVHLLVMFAIYTSPRWMPARAISLLSPQEEIQKNKNLTFLEASPDRQVVTKRPETNRISDKDRIATSRHPQLQKQLQELADARRQGAPGPVAQPAQPPVPQPQPAQSGNPGPPQQAPRQAPPSTNNESAALQPPPQQRNPFQTGSSAGSAIQQAARAAAQSRGGGGEGGIVNPNPNNPAQGSLEILSDTLGVDFAPYIKRIVRIVESNLSYLTPESARAPLYKQGTVVVDIVIAKDGKITSMQLTRSSGDVALDRAAWGSLTASNPLPPLPSEFRSDHIILRCIVLFNPDGTIVR